MKSFLSLFLTILIVACAHSEKATSSSSSSSANSDTRIKGYGDFLFMPPGSIAIRNFVDRDGDGIDDRYQTGPGKKGLPMGFYYKAP